MSNNKYKFLIFCLLLLQVYSLDIFAQETQSKFTPIFNSPYSRYGLGEMNDRSLIRQQAMGDVSIASLENNEFSLTNPASYARVKSFVFETGLNTKIFEIRSAQDTFSNKDFRFSYIAVAFPIDTSLKWGFSFGLMPASKIGYRIRNQYIAPGSSLLVSELQAANGGFNKFYAGSSIMLFKNFYIGANAAYFFGNETYGHFLDFPEDNNMKAIRKLTSNSIKGLMWDAGLIYQVPFGNNSAFQIGLSANLPASLSASQQTNTYTFFLDNELNDTIQRVSGRETNAYIPGGFGGGIQLKKSADFRIAADVYYRQWSKLEYFDRTDELKDQFSGGLGIQWSPKGGDAAVRGFSNYIKTVQFRLGYKYAQSYFNTANGQPEYMAFTGGLGLPVGAKGSSIDFSVELGQMGNLNNNDLQERFIKLSLGFHLFDDTWFKRRKIE